MDGVSYAPLHKRPNGSVATLQTSNHSLKWYPDTDGDIFGAATINMSVAEYVSGTDTHPKADGAKHAVPYIFHSVRCLPFYIFPEPLPRGS